LLPLLFAGLPLLPSAEIVEKIELTLLNALFRTEPNELADKSNESPTMLAISAYSIEVTPLSLM
jgi:hypothetical protein